MIQSQRNKQTMLILNSLRDKGAPQPSMHPMGDSTEQPEESQPEDTDMSPDGSVTQPRTEFPELTPNPMSRNSKPKKKYQLVAQGSRDNDESLI